MVCTCVYWLLQNKKFYQIGMHLIYLIHLNDPHVYYGCHVLQFEIDIFDLDTTIVNVSRSNFLPQKNHFSNRLLVYNKKGGLWKSLHKRSTLIHIGHRNYLNCPNQNRNIYCKLYVIVVLTRISFIFVLF